MRIIAGEYRHRTLFTPRDGTTTRPIPDRVKEALFNLLRGWTEDAVVVDAFAGTGALGLEAVSRGASRCVFFERDRRIAELIQKNIDHLGCADRCEVVKGDALGPVLLTRSPRPIDLLFFDPPYPLVEDPESWGRVSVQFSRAVAMLGEKGFAVLRTPWPFRHRIGAEAPEEAAPSRRKRKGRREEPEEEERVWEGEDLRELEEGDYVDAEFDEGEEAGEEEEFGMMEGFGEPAPAPGHWEMVSLEIAGAEGPETHVYGSTAVHLYMKRGAEGGATSGPGVDAAG